MSVDPFGLAAVGVGSVFLYAGIKGLSIPGAFQSIIQGQSPSTAPTANPIAQIAPSESSPGSDQAVTTVGGIPSGNAQQALQQAAAARGWGSGIQWQALQNVEMAEAGFNPHAKNPDSGAYGIAQALGHGNGSATQGTESNQYGGFGLTDAQARAANSGDAGAQAVWMVNYIAAEYGNPVNAWQHEQANHWY
jgi:resuscitation-promoting factor RpfB